MLTKAHQPLSLLLKLSPLVDELSLYDVVNTPGVAADLSHISSNAVSSKRSPLRPTPYLLLTIGATENHWLPSSQRWRKDCLQGCRHHCHPRWHSPYVAADNTINVVDIDRLFV